MNKDKIIYTKDDFIVFKDETNCSCSMGNYVGKTLKEIEELTGKEIKEVYRYITRKKIMYGSKRKYQRRKI